MRGTQNQRALSSRTRDGAHGRNRENHATLEESIEREGRIQKEILNLYTFVCVCVCVCVFFLLSEACDGVVPVMRERGGE